MTHPLCTPADHALSRRAWLGLSAAGALGSLATPALADAVRKRAKQVLFIWLDGGMSQLESWDPKPNTPFGGPFRAIPTSVPGIHVSELLPRTAKLMHRLCVVRSLSTADNSHSAGVARIQRGDPKNRGVEYPFLGSAVAKLIGGTSTLPPYMWIKPGSSGFVGSEGGFLGPKYGALALGDGKPPTNILRPATLSASDDAERRRLRSLMEKKYAAGRPSQAVEANTHVYAMAEQLERHRALFDATTYPTRDRERYGDYDLGRHLLMARRMLEAGVTFVKVTSYGWDTHGDNFNGHLSLMGKFDRPFAAIVEDLQDRGMLDHTLVIAMSEFGRTPRINGHVGRDHWPEAWSLAMAGCGLNKGLVVGKTNALGTEVDGVEHDIGALFHTWFRALGIDPAKTPYDNNGQPLPIAHEEMSAIEEALA